MIQNISFKGEFQFRRYSDTSTQGQQVVFAVSDRVALESFIGKEGKRFMAVLVEIGDDEQPVAGNQASEKPRERLGDLAWRAVQWCKEEEFFHFIRPIYDRHMGGNGSGYGDVTPDDFSDREEGYCRHVVLTLCDVNSRKELDTNSIAARKFHQLVRGPYQKHLIARGIVR